jgi:predicted phosphodiesterase
LKLAFLILSDIHANQEALQAVLEDARGQYDRIICLGDLAGYGAEPNEVIEWARSNVAAVIRGNHDKICVSDESLEAYHPSARASTDWTRRTLSPQNHAFLENLPRGPLRYEDFDLVHGSPADEDEYLVGLSDASLALEFIAAPVTFFGHTHIQGGFLVTRTGSKRIVPAGTIELEPDHYYLVNPGAVGQPRDGDPRAAYALYFPERRTVEYRRAAYNVASAAAKIRAAGLPEHLAARLFEGA